MPTSVGAIWEQNKEVLGLQGVLRKASRGRAWEAFYFSVKG